MAVHPQVQEVVDHFRVEAAALHQVAAVREVPQAVVAVVAVIAEAITEGN